MVPIILVSLAKVSLSAYIKRLVKELRVESSQITVIEKDGATLKIDSVRKLSEIFLRSSTDTRMVVLRDFETARSETQNAMLKILEEKTDNIQFVITTTDQSSILPTIASRCKIVKLVATRQSADATDFEDYFMKIFPTTDKIKAEKVVWYIDLFIDHTRARIKIAVGSNDSKSSLKYLEFMKECIEYRYLLNHNNLNAQMVIDNLLIKFNTLERLTISF